MKLAAARSWTSGKAENGPCLSSCWNIKGNESTAVVSRCDNISEQNNKSHVISLSSVFLSPKCVAVSKVWNAAPLCTGGTDSATFVSVCVYPGVQLILAVVEEGGGSLDLRSVDVCDQVPVYCC